MEECSKQLIDTILAELLDAPYSQIDDDVRMRVENCNGTYAEKYDTIVEISKMDSVKVSKFVKEFCSLDKYYLRPISEI